MQKILISCDEFHSPIMLSDYVRECLFKKDKDLYFDAPLPVSDFSLNGTVGTRDLEYDFDAIVEDDQIYMFLNTKDALRADPYLIQLIEDVGPEKAAGKYGKLKIVEVPDGVQWSIGSMDVGPEWVQENTRYWS